MAFPIYNPQDAMFFYLFISTDALHVSGGSSAHHQEHITHIQLQVCPPILLLAAIVDEVELPSHPRQQQAAVLVDNT